MKRLLLPVLGLAVMLPGAHVAAQAPDQIQIDQNCRVASAAAHGIKLVFRANLEMCHIEHRHRTTVPNDVVVAEQTYVLHNPSAGAVTFVVKRTVPWHWHVDSYPPPAEIKGGNAIFRVEARPGETVRLHVGVRSYTGAGDQSYGQYLPINY